MKYGEVSATLQRLMTGVFSLFFLSGLAFTSPLPVQAHAHNSHNFHDFPIVGVLHTGGHPEALAVDTQTHMLYIADETEGQLVGFDPLVGTVRWRTPLGGAMSDIQADSTSHHVYAIATPPRSRENKLFILDGTTGHILAQLPAGSGDSSIALDSHRQRVYVSTTGTNTIFVFTFQQGWQAGPVVTQVAQWHIGGHPAAIGVNSHLDRLYVADSAAAMVTVVDEANGHTVAAVPVAALPLAPMRVNEADGRVYLVCGQGQELDTIDGTTNTLLAHTPVVPYPEGMVANTATGRIYVANEGDPEGRGSRVQSDTITVIDRQSFNVLGTFRVGPTPDGVEADPALHRVYIALEDSGAIVELTDSTEIPLKLDTTSQQTTVAHQTLNVLRQATTVIILAMLLTVVGATLLALLRYWRARGIPQTLPADASAPSEQHTLRQ